MTDITWPNTVHNQTLKGDEDIIKTWPTLKLKLRRLVDEQCSDEEFVPIYALRRTPPLNNVAVTSTIVGGDANGPAMRGDNANPSSKCEILLMMY